MRILQLSLTETAGVPYRMKQAIRDSGHICHMVTFSQQIFPGDVVSPKWGEVCQLIEAADVVHVHSMNTYAVFEPELRNKPFVVMIHGTPDNDLNLEPNFPHVVSTPDLLLAFANAAYLPCLILPDKLVSSPPIPDNGPVRIFKSFSRHDKSLETFEQVLAPILNRLNGAAEYLRPQGMVPHSVHMRSRGSCHISFDQMSTTQTYGIESLESLAQGIIPINGACDFVLAAFKQTVGAAPPFMITRTPIELAKALIELFEEALQYPSRFEERRALGPQFIEKYYQPKDHIEAWFSVYESCIAGASLLGVYKEPTPEQRKMDSLRPPQNTVHINPDAPALNILWERAKANPEWTNNFPTLTCLLEVLLKVRQPPKAA